MVPENTAALVLAAGAGTRMKSTKPKVAHALLGKPLVRWVIDAARAAGIDEVVTVVGHEKEQVIPLVEGISRICEQPERKGTADAVSVSAPFFEGFDGSLVVLSGDCPLITPQTIAALATLRAQENAAVALLTMQPADPTGYGRIVRNSAGEVERIVEQKDATAAETAISECNSGFYCFDARVLFDALGQVDANNSQGEFYLTDVIEIVRAAGRRVCALQAEDSRECLGVNSRAQLAQATRIAQRRINEEHLANGVTMWAPDLAWIGPDVHIDADVELLPDVYLLGETSVGTGSVIGPHTRLTNTQVGSGCLLDETIALDTLIDNEVKCGPRAYLRPGTHMCDGSKAGTHVEIKKSTIGAGSKVPHLSYIGDTFMGSGVNIGAGSITCNYDGKHKFATMVGNDVFVGSSTMLVAPVTVGNGAVIGAGSVITKDVSADSLALTRAEQKELEGWAARRRQAFADED